MAVICANCGEELLGAVNRCWKCGREVLSTPDAATVPPVRRAPLPETVPKSPLPEAAPKSDAQIADEKNVDASAAAGYSENTSPAADSPLDEDKPAIPTPAIPTPASPEPAAPEPPSNPGRVAPETTSPETTSLEATSPALPAILASSLASPSKSARGGVTPWLAIGSVILGLTSIALGAISPWVLLLAGGGLACGIIGYLRSRRRITATIGLLLCLLGVTVSSARLAYDTFLFIRGEPAVPVAPMPEDEYPLAPFDSADPGDPLQ